MAQIKWENMRDSDVRAEVEAVLESQGEAKRIRDYLDQHPGIAQWRQEIRQLCRLHSSEIGFDKLTADMLYDRIAAKAREMIPKDVTEDVKAKLVQFLQTQFEDHI
jgi:hypothetical protein